MTITVPLQFHLDMMLGNLAMKNIFTPLFKFFGRLSRTEASILEFVAQRLPQAEQLAFRSQVKAAQLQKNFQTILFTYPKPQTAIAPFADTLFAKLAVVTVKGRASGFTLEATVSLSRGVLHSLDFNLMPWSDYEDLDIHAELAPFDTPLFD